MTIIDMDAHKQWVKEQSIEWKMIDNDPMSLCADINSIRLMAFKDVDWHKQKTLKCDNSYNLWFNWYLCEMLFGGQYPRIIDTGGLYGGDMELTKYEAEVAYKKYKTEPVKEIIF